MFNLWFFRMVKSELRYIVRIAKYLLFKKNITYLYFLNWYKLLHY